MRADFHQRRFAHFLDHLPGGEFVARRHQAAKIDFFVCRGIHPASNRCPKGWPVVGFQQRPDAGIETAIPIIKGEQNRFFRQHDFTVMSIQNLLNADRVIAIITEPGYLIAQRTGTHREVALIGCAILYIVITQNQKTIFRPWMIGRQRRSLIRRNIARRRIVRTAARGNHQPASDECAKP